MKRILNFSTPILVGLVIFSLSILPYKKIGRLFEIKKVSVAISDEDLYRALRVPLVVTILDNDSTTFKVQDQDLMYAYSFKEYMTNISYLIILSKNVDFQNCAGCINDYEFVTLSCPKNNDQFVVTTLKEFIIQMVRAKNGKATNSTLVWNTGDFVWKIIPQDEKDRYLIKVTSNEGQKWKVLM